ncbi:AP-1 complex subunit mu-2 isoform X2 [Mycteria americana]|uniref:AP-1 complex subunit mu-2 isoform X2 n=1 Tax=Mycteria americana TaxID=33587 RepID=UPI003F584826
MPATPLISRNYKGDVGLGEIEHFMGLLLQREEEGALAPLLTHGKVHFLWIKHANLYLVATTKKNSNASLVYSFLYKVVEVFCEYFKELEEESIRDNFVIVYELLDELMDFGFPQTTDSKILQEYITQESNKLETGKSRVPTTVTNAVSWRSEGIKYKKNEVFIDVIESVNLLLVPPPAGERQRQRAAERGGGHHQAEGLPLGDARAAPGLERPRPLRADRTGQEQVGGAGGREVPPVRPALPLRQRPHHLLHPPRRRLRAHVLPPQHPGEAAHLDRVGHREVLPQPGGDHGQGQGPVQEAVGGQRGGDRGAGAQRRRLAQVQDQRGLRQVPPGEERRHLDHQVLPGGQGAPDARPLRAAQRGEGGGGGAAAHLRPLRDPLLHRLGHPDYQLRTS